MDTFFVTFGVMYADKSHPSVQGAHPESYIEIVAPDEMTARRIAFGITNGHFSTIHTQEYMDSLLKEKNYFPQGACMRITVEPIYAV